MTAITLWVDTFLIYQIKALTIFQTIILQEEEHLEQIMEFQQDQGF